MLVRVQVKSILGYSRRPNPASTDILKLPQISFPRHDPVHEQLKDLLGPTWTPYFQWREFVMGLCWLILLFTMKEVGKRNKCALPRLAQPRCATVLAAHPLTWGSEPCLSCVAARNVADRVQCMTASRRHGAGLAQYLGLCKPPASQGLQGMSLRRSRVGVANGWVTGAVCASAGSWCTFGLRVR